MIAIGDSLVNLLVRDVAQEVVKRPLVRGFVVVHDTLQNVVFHAIGEEGDGCVVVHGSYLFGCDFLSVNIFNQFL